MIADDPFRHSVLARRAVSRVLVSGAAVALLWIAIAWAVSMP